MSGWKQTRSLIHLLHVYSLALLLLFLTLQQPIVSTHTGQASLCVVVHISGFLTCICSQTFLTFVLLKIVCDCLVTLYCLSFETCASFWNNPGLHTILTYLKQSNSSVWKAKERILPLCNTDPTESHVAATRIEHHNVLQEFVYNNLNVMRYIFLSFVLQSLLKMLPNYLFRPNDNVWNCFAPSEDGKVIIKKG